MTSSIAITDETQLAAAVTAAAEQGTPLEILGHGTKRGFGRPVDAVQVIDLKGLSGVIAYEPAELVLDAKAATPVAEIDAVLRGQNQELAFEPPDLGPLLGTSSQGSIGGVIACNLSGPRRIRAGAARDHVLGLIAVSGRGEVFKAGGRVVKNVTGYDLCKLLAGSFGTLAVMSTVTVKVLPAAEKVRTLLLHGLDLAGAWKAMGQALSSGHEVSGAAFIPAALTGAFDEPRLGAGSVTALRVEGPARSVEDRCAALQVALGASCESDELHSTNARKFWQKARDVRPFVGDPRAVWRISVPPHGGAALAQTISSIPGADAFFDWGGGLCWAAVPETGDAGAGLLRAALAASGGGHATLIRASATTRLAVPPFQPLDTALRALEDRIKQTFDPKGILNPGRMWPGV